MIEAILPFGPALIGLLVIVVLIFAIKTSYAIERVTNPRPKGAILRNTNMLATLAGIGVSRSDQKTMALLRRLRRLMSVVAGLMSCLFIFAFTQS